MLSKTNKAVNMGQLLRCHLSTILYIWQIMWSFAHMEKQDYVLDVDREEGSVRIDNSVEKI
jgi:hypothetical protein